MRKNALYLAALVASGAFAAGNAAYPKPAQTIYYTTNNGFYVGGQLGYANQDYTASQMSPYSVSSVTNTGTAGRLYAGYNFSGCLGLELGYLLMPQVQYSGINGTNVNLNFTQQIVDLTLRGNYPVADKVSLFGKVGAAYVNLGSASATSSNLTYSLDDLSSTVVPTVGLGIKYDMNESVYADFGANYYFSNADVQSSSFLGIGLGYRFG